MTCTKLCSVYWVTAMVVLIAAVPAEGAVMFADTFDRATTQVDDIDATTTGITADFTLPSDVYIERDEFLAGPAGSGPLTQPEADALTNVENNQLHLADGPNASVLHINHNFVGAGITGMKASLDIVSNDGTADELGRWVGIGFGATQSEAENAAYDFNAGTTPPSWKGHQLDTVPGSGFADLFVAWERTGNGTSDDDKGRITLWENGDRTAIFDNGGSFYTVGDTLEIELAFADFNAGTTVSADISYGGVAIGSETFAWDNTDNNYIGITARQNNAGWTLDNLSIEATTVPEPGSLALAGLMVASMGTAVSMRKRLG